LPLATASSVSGVFQNAARTIASSRSRYQQRQLQELKAEAIIMNGSYRSLKNRSRLGNALGDSNGSLRSDSKLQASGSRLNASKKVEEEATPNESSGSLRSLNGSSNSHSREQASSKTTDVMTDSSSSMTNLTKELLIGQEEETPLFFLLALSVLCTEEASAILRIRKAVCLRIKGVYVKNNEYIYMINHWIDLMSTTAYDTMMIVCIHHSEPTVHYHSTLRISL
jgi:hypothetical protein